MYTSLKIVKKLSHAWMYYPNGLTTGFAISKGYLTGDEVTGLVQIVEQGKTKRPEVPLLSISVVDEFLGDPILTFSTFEDLQQQLVLLGNPLVIDKVSNEALANDNVFISKPGFNILANTITIKPNWIWKLQGVTYTNPTSVDITVVYSAVGKSRLEYIIPNNSNGFDVISGVESSSTPLAPQLPANGLYITFYTVTNDAILNAQFPIDGSEFIKKIENQDFVVSYTGNSTIERINIIDDRSSIVITGAITTVKSINILPEFIRPGKLFYLKNKTGADVTLANDLGTGNVKMLFSNGLNFVIANNEILHLKLNSTTLNLELVGSSLSNKLETGGYTGSAAALNQRITDLEFPDEIIVRGTVSLVAGTVSIDASSFTVRINQNLITNALDYSTLISPATAATTTPVSPAYNRTDIIVIDDLGEFMLFEGIESQSAAIKPEAPINTIEVASIDITGTSFSEPTQLPNRDAQTKIYQNGELQVFRKPNTLINYANTEPNIGDWCIGFVEGQFINAEYLGPNKALLTSFNI